MAREMASLVVDDRGVARCSWCMGDAMYEAYHDEEWGRPVADDARLFEKICLEGFQAGLSWLTILRKRDRFRKVFCGFDPSRVARFTERDVARLLGDPGIVRHRGKIESTINNARRCLPLIEQFGSLGAYLEQFRPARHVPPRAMADVPAQTAESKSLSRDLKSRGVSFVGPTTMYAMMQAVGLVNDHFVGCHARPEGAAAAFSDGVTAPRPR